MKKSIKKALVIFLTLALLSATFTCFASGLNQDAVNKHKGQYKNYLLLGDSVASGYRDEMNDNDKAYNRTYNETTYWRVPGSYGDIIANSIIDDKSMTAFAGPGFRTIEMRYMLEDDYAKNCDDEYLFHPSQLYVYEDYGYLPGDERVRQAYQQAVKDADLITVGVGGNDWGAYLGWVVSDVLEKENVADKYMKQAQEIIENSELDLSSFEKLVEIAHYAGALPALIKAIPEALSYGLGNFYKNWDIMIQDIYDFNSDVTLMVLGMSDNSLKGKYFSYPGAEGEKIETDEMPEAIAGVVSDVINFIMTVGNKPMVEGAKKFGYTYVDTAGTTYVDSHPDAGGHEFIASRVIESLPDPEISTKLDDVKPGHKNYASIEYVLLNGIMTTTSETTFSPDDALTKGQLAAAFNAINGTADSIESTDKSSVIQFALELFKNGAKKGLSGFIKSFRLSVEVISDSGLNFTANITRGEAAKYLKLFCEI